MGGRWLWWTKMATFGVDPQILRLVELLVPPAAMFQQVISENQLTFKIEPTPLF